VELHVFLFFVQFPKIEKVVWRFFYSLNAKFSGLSDSEAPLER